jgi:hypothetical protein
MLLFFQRYLRNVSTQELLWAFTETHTSIVVGKLTERPSAFGKVGNQYSSGTYISAGTGPRK